MLRQSKLNSLNPHRSRANLTFLDRSSTRIHLTLITIVDFIVRAAYMTGKTPVLPIVAATMGATDIYLGFISSISALTGMILKPFIGLLSDRQGRRIWLFVGAAFFVIMPFVYRFISTPEQLLMIRLIHGIATAIYGPVTLAMVVEMGSENRAVRVGIFSLGRTGGYIVGPALGGYLLYTLENPVEAYTVIGIMSMAALVPLFYLPETSATANSKSPTAPKASFIQQLRLSLSSAAATPAVWIASGFEAMNYMVTYAAKAFLPLYALAVGRNVLEAGLFFTVQQGVAMMAKPLCGWLGDRWSHMAVITTALFGMATALILLTFSANVLVFYVAAVLLGLTEALIIPSATALLAYQINEGTIGTGLGVVGTLRNASKVFGPILAGFSIAATSYETTFLLMSLLLIIVGTGLLISQIKPPRRQPT